MTLLMGMKALCVALAATGLRKAAGVDSSSLCRGGTSTRAFDVRLTPASTREDVEQPLSFALLQVDTVLDQQLDHVSEAHESLHAMAKEDVGLGAQLKAWLQQASFNYWKQTTGLLPTVLICVVVVLLLLIMVVMVYYRVGQCASPGEALLKKHGFEKSTSGSEDSRSSQIVPPKQNTKTSVTGYQRQKPVSNMADASSSDASSGPARNLPRPICPAYAKQREAVTFEFEVSAFLKWNDAGGRIEIPFASRGKSSSCGYPNFTALLEPVGPGGKMVTLEVATATLWHLPLVSISPLRGKSGESQLSARTEQARLFGPDNEVYGALVECDGTLAIKCYDNNLVVLQPGRTNGELVEVLGQRGLPIASLCAASRPLEGFRCGQRELCILRVEPGADCVLIVGAVLATLLQTPVLRASLTRLASRQAMTAVQSMQLPASIRV